jgi:hypothetical protein
MVTSCLDPEQLDRWLGRAGTASCAADMFRDLQPAGQRRGSQRAGGATKARPTSVPGAKADSVRL